jgi:ABC-type sugar transport system ATPase subunit
MIELDQVSIRSGGFALTGVTLSIPEAAYAVLMGGTGQGKTTLLEAICGLRTVTGGRVLLNHVEVTHWKPAERGVGYVPQDLALFPSLTVRGHLEFALRLRRWSRQAMQERVAELAEMLRIEPLLNRRIKGLSGGESQRVALGRALSFRPRVLLLDEPLNALDEATRDRLAALLRTIQADSGLTVLHVTHSRVEARQLAQRLIILKGGRLHECPLSELEGAADDSETESPATGKPEVVEKTKS